MQEYAAGSEGLWDLKGPGQFGHPRVPPQQLLNIENHWFRDNKKI